MILKLKYGELKPGKGNWRGIIGVYASIIDDPIAMGFDFAFCRVSTAFSNTQNKKRTDNSKNI
jgi:hypothetical protein